MKKSKTRIVILIICIAAGYLLISFIGLLAMIRSSMISQQQEYMKQPVEVSSETGWEQEFLKSIGRVTGHVQMFDTDGRLLYDTFQNRPAEEGPDPMDIDFDVSGYIHLVNSGHPVRRFSLVRDNVFGSLRVVYIYGTPVMCGGKQIGSVFGINSPLYFSRTLKVFLIFFTAAYVIAALSVLLVMIMRARYEDARQKYIANVTHALKTPVTAIKALAETLYDGAESDPEEQKYDLELILQQADLQVDMVQNMLRLSHIQTYGRKLKKIRVSIRELIDDPVKKHMPACEQKGIALVRADSLSDIPDLRTDPDAIRDVLDCLLDNSVKFTPEGGTITIDARVEGSRAVMEVRDTGIGIDREMIPKVFDRFYTSSVGNAEGNGLGLAIAKELTGHLHEKIWVESEPGAGTSVFFTVKICR